MRTLLAGYFDGDGAIISRMLDPRLAGSPLHGFRTEMREMLKEVSDRLIRLEAARDARADERDKGTARGSISRTPSRPVSTPSSAGPVISSSPRGPPSATACAVARATF